MKQHPKQTSELATISKSTSIAGKHQKTKKPSKEVTDDYVSDKLPEPDVLADILNTLKEQQELEEGKSYALPKFV